MSVGEQPEAGKTRAEDDHRRRPRRRGDALHEAIFQATLAELAEVGYAELTMDRVAARAKASKGSLYRRWPSRLELVVDAVRYKVPNFTPAPDTGDLRTDLIAQLRQFVDQLNGPAGEAARGMMIQLVRNPELLRALREQLIDPAIAPLLEVLRRGVARGEVRPSALTPMVAGVAPALLRQHVLLLGEKITDEELVAIVDEVILPLVSVKRSASEPEGGTEGPENGTESPEKDAEKNAEKD